MLRRFKYRLTFLVSLTTIKRYGLAQGSYKIHSLSQHQRSRGVPTPRTAYNHGLAKTPQ